MHLRRLLNLALAVFVTVGLAVAPLATPAAASQRHETGLMDMPVMDMPVMDMPMSPDMPCCPEGQKNRDCQDCPLMAICVLKITQAGPSVTFAELLRYAIRMVHLFSDDAHAEGLDRPPPEQPPRILA